MRIVKRSLMRWIHLVNILQKYVFSWRLKMMRLSAGSRRLSGSEFQVDGTATAKHPGLKLFRR